MAEFPHRLQGYALLSKRGLEIGALHVPAQVPHHCRVEYCDAMTKEEAIKYFPELDANDITDAQHICDLDTSGLSIFPEHAYDFIILNHVIEHVANPIKVIEEIFRVVCDNGLVVISAPDKNYTFDKKRALTRYDHLVEEYQNHVCCVTDAHYLDFLEGVHPEIFALSPEDIAHVVQNVRTRREHAHVWDSHTFKAFLESSLRLLHIQAECLFESAGEENHFEYFSVWKKCSSGQSRQTVLPDAAPIYAGGARISVVIRTYTASEEIFELLTALAEQTVPPYEFVIIDSGSAAPVQQRLRALHGHGVETSGGGAIPLRLLEIPQRTYQSARALNQAIAAAQGDLMAIVSQDALPANAWYLAQLAAAFDTDGVAGSYGRQTMNVPGYPLCRKDLETSYPAQSRVQHQPDCWFVNTCSMVRRDLWQAHAFDERALISEDHEWAKWWQQQGYVVKYQAEAVVYHYHAYDRLAEVWQRFMAEGQGLAYIHRRRLRLGRALCGFAREVGSDGVWLARQGIPWYWPVALVRRAVKYAALYCGYRAGDVEPGKGKAIA